ncbi:MAG: RNA methyltransferase [Proteobacteria bacterium]|jgi:tRNA (guanosine-2'-O-)-methyltransferase|nr:RNA methyltransferase [Pseudomonadota bacterium]
MFPFEAQIQVGSHSFDPKVVIEVVGPLLTQERIQKIEKVLEGRTFSNPIVLENIYDRGNASAVMRSAEALGFGQVHMIELGEKFKESQRTTAGADKWVELKKWKSTRACVDHLKEQGFKIAVTYLDASSVPLSEVDFAKPTALVLGNEKDGVSPEMVAAADYKVVIPMTGFVQSYNISVAAALGCYHMYLDRMSRLGACGDLTETQKNILKAHYFLRTQASAEDVLLEKRSRGEL